MIAETVLQQRAATAARSAAVTSGWLEELGISAPKATYSIERAEMSAARAGNAFANKMLTDALDEVAFDHAALTNRVAAQEAVDAYAAARSEMIRSLPEGIQRSLVKIWQSAGDARVCGRCYSHDGETIPATDDFPDGDPPLHPMCRCSYVLDKL